MGPIDWLIVAALAAILWLTEPIDRIFVELERWLNRKLRTQRTL